MTRYPKCNQCNRQMLFDTGYKNCDACRKRAREKKGITDYRVSLSDNAPHRFRIFESSQNRKLGGIHSTYASPSTCPRGCPLRNGLCYGEQGYLRKHWREVNRHGVPWEEHLQALSRLSGMRRLFVVGDFPGQPQSDVLEAARVDEMAEANAGHETFGFTHRKVEDSRVVASLRLAAAKGVHIALSVESVQQAIEVVSLGLRPALTVPDTFPYRKRVLGLGVVNRCPAQYTDRTCSECRWCSHPKTIVAFIPHGVNKRRMNSLLMSKEER